MSLMVVMCIGLASMIKEQKVHGSTTVMDKKFHGQTGDQVSQMMEVAGTVQAHKDLPTAFTMVNGMITLVPGITTSFVNSR